MATGFTDDEILVLLALDAELDVDVDVDVRRSRLWDTAWWVALSVGAIGGLVTFLQAAQLMTPAYFGSG
jgi:hypothetical protein